MKLAVRKEFVRNLEAVKDKDVLDELRFVLSNLEAASSLSALEGCKELKGRKGYYRIRIEDYRLGIRSEGDIAELVCLYHRSDISSHFP
jgi:mRNA-degrading endonuclease RelE of RelBE toxin-antitoxin system